MKKFLERVLFWVRLKGNPAWEMEWQHFEPNPQNTFREALFLERWHKWRFAALLLGALLLQTTLLLITILIALRSA